MEYLKRAVVDYLNNAEANYAIMIDGEWGSGKTYFWNNILRNEIESNLKTIYVSLYGVKTIEEINKKITIEMFTAFIPNDKLRKIAGKNGNVLPELGKVALNIGKMLGLDHVFEATKNVYNELTEGASLSIEDLLNIKKRFVFCFDDLERTSIDIAEVLGFINNLVEHDGIKAILICNQEELAKKRISENIELKTMTSSLILDRSNKNIKDLEAFVPLIKDLNNSSLYTRNDDYQLIKEKLVGKTYKLEYEPATLVGIIESIDNQLYKSYMVKHQDLLLAVFKKSESRNVRIFKQAVADFQTIYLNVLRVDKEFSTEVLEAMLIFAFAYSFELKKGNEMVKNFKNIASNSDFQSAIMMQHILKWDSKEKNFKSVEEIFRERYYSNNGYHNYIFFKFIEKFIRDGFVDEKLMLQELQDITDSIKQPNQPSTIKLVEDYYWQMNDDDFDRTVKEVYNLFKNGEVHFAKYLKGFLVFRRFAEKELIPFTKEEVFQDFINGIVKTKEKFQYTENLADSYVILRLPQNDEKINEIKLAAENINNELLEVIREKKASDLFSKLTSSEITQFTNLLKDEFSFQPLMSYLNVDKLFKSIISLNNSSIVLLHNALLEHYQHGGYYTRDKETIDKLKGMLDAFVATKPNSLSRHLLVELSNSLGDISEKLVS